MRTGYDQVVSIAKKLLWQLAKSCGLFFGATLLCFILIVKFGPDLVFNHIGRNATPEEIESKRHELGYDRPILERYAKFLWRLGRGDLGHSDDNGEPIAQILKRSLPVSLFLIVPGFVLGNLVGMLFAMFAAWFHGRAVDHGLMVLAVLGMSISFPVTIIILQWLLSSGQGLGWFPVHGWDVVDLSDYINYVTVPTLALFIASFGYNTRFFRALLLEELSKDYVTTARAYGAGAIVIMCRHVLPNTLIPVLTRIVFTIPSLVVGGSLLMEKHFGVPGIGRVTYTAVSTGDQSVLLVVVSLTAIVFVVLNQSIDYLYEKIDPRIRSVSSP